MIIPNKHLSQVQTLKLHVNLCHPHHRGRVTPLQRLRSTIPLLNTFRKTNLVIPEAANKTYALILILITQNYTDTNVCKILDQPLFVRYLQSLPLSFSFFSPTSFKFFFFSGALTYTGTSNKTNRNAAFNIIKFELRAIATTTGTRGTEF